MIHLVLLKFLEGPMKCEMARLYLGVGFLSVGFVSKVIVAYIYIKIPFSTCKVSHFFLF